MQCLLIQNILIDIMNKAKSFVVSALPDAGLGNKLFTWLMGQFLPIKIICDIILQA